MHVRTHLEKVLVRPVAQDIVVRRVFAGQDDLIRAFGDFAVGCTGRRPDLNGELLLTRSTAEFVDSAEITFVQAGTAITVAIRLATVRRRGKSRTDRRFHDQLQFLDCHGRHASLVIEMLNGLSKKWCSGTMWQRLQSVTRAGSVA